LARLQEKFGAARSVQHEPPLNLVDLMGLSSSFATQTGGYGSNAILAAENLRQGNYGTAAYYELLHTVETAIAITPLGALENVAARGGVTTGACGTATSIKSIDLNATTYQNIGSLTSKLNGYVDAVANFNGATFSGVAINSSQITARQLQLAIPSGSSAAKQAAINAAATRAQGMGVGFRRHYRSVRRHVVESLPEKWHSLCADRGAD
jgi:CDI toxin restriction endonuclease-like domain